MENLWKCRVPPGGCEPRPVKATARHPDASLATTFFVHGLVDTFLVFTPLYGLFWLLLARQREETAGRERDLGEQDTARIGS